MKQKTLCFIVGILAVAVVGVVVLSATAAAQDNRPERIVGVLAHRDGTGSAPAVLTEHTLTGTFLDVSGGVSVSCAGTFCLATPVPIFSEKIPCPGAKGFHCTFQITIAAQNQVGSNDSPANPGEDGTYQFLVDGVPPSPGPTDSLGYYAWSMYQAASAITGYTYSLTAEVSNTSANQVHSVVISIGCQEILLDPSGCFALTAFDNLQIARYHP